MGQWRRTLAVAASAQTMSIMGFSFVVPFLPLYIQQLGVHGAARVTLWAGILSGGSAICMAVAAPIWGALADRYGRKIMVTRSMFSAAILIGLMGLAQNVAQLLILRMLQGVFTGTVSASQALVAAQAPRDRLGFSMGVMQTAVFSGNSVGPLVGGVIADGFGFRSSFFVATAMFVVGGSLVQLMVVEDGDFGRHSAMPRPRLVASMFDALRAPMVPAMVATYFVVQFAVTVVFPVLPQFVQELQGAAGHAATITGLMFAAAGLAGAAASLAIGPLSDRIGFRSILVVASIAAALLSIPQYWVMATWQLFVLRVAIGVALGAIMPASSALVASLVPPDRRGTVYGLMGSATSIGFGAGPLMAAAVVAFSGIRPVFFTASLLLGLIALWVGLMVRVPEAVESDSERRSRPGLAAGS